MLRLLIRGSRKRPSEQGFTQPRSRSSKTLCSNRVGKPGSRGPSVHKLLVVGVFPLKHWGGGDGSWHGILRLPTGMRTERRSCCWAKKSQCSSEDLLEVGGPQRQRSARVLSTLLEGTSVRLGSYGSCQALAFGAVVDLACREDGSGCSAGLWWGGAEEDAVVSLEVLDWDVRPEFASFAHPAAILACCVVFPLPRLATRSVRILAVLLLLCLV